MALSFGRDQEKRKEAYGGAPTRPCPNAAVEDPEEDHAAMMVCSKGGKSSGGRLLARDNRHHQRVSQS